jgi:hypothetical protein
MDIRPVSAGFAQQIVWTVGRVMDAKFKPLMCEMLGPNMTSFVFFNFFSFCFFLHNFVLNIYIKAKGKGKGKAVPLQAWSGPEG